MKRRLPGQRPQPATDQDLLANVSGARLPLFPGFDFGKGAWCVQGFDRIGRFIAKGRVRSEQRETGQNDLQENRSVQAAAHAPRLVPPSVLSKQISYSGTRFGHLDALTRIFHIGDNGAPVCNRLLRLERPKPTTCRRSGLSAFRARCEICGLKQRRCSSVRFFGGTFVCETKIENQNYPPVNLTLAGWWSRSLLNPFCCLILVTGAVTLPRGNP